MVIKRTVTKNTLFIFQILNVNVYEKVSSTRYHIVKKRRKKGSVFPIQTQIIIVVKISDFDDTATAAKSTRFDGTNL